MRWTLCIPETGGVCLEGVKCTVGGSETQVLITMKCYELNHAYKCCRLKCGSCMHCIVYVCFVFAEVCPGLIAKLRGIADAMLT